MGWSRPLDAPRFTALKSAALPDLRAIKHSALECNRELKVVSIKRGFK